MTISSLIVHQSLEIKNVVIELRRVSATYTVTTFNGDPISNELIYSYDNKYFNPKDPKDCNLASIMLAQVAMNYGLFFKELIFDGFYDMTDQRFIIDMTENTSREIYLNKIIAKNEFLKAPYDQVEFEKLKKYTQANIIFKNTKFASLPLEKETTKPDYNKYTILSSGGKDSLLTYGIIKEIGDPHPVFINESGRHWFTAVNAHRYLKEKEPNTAKPWCNSDRIFNWMVKQMPFIKENFQSIRADIYPIRLWTVSVFLFGVLPIARKRNTGNILIGNEYDTTVKSSPLGVTDFHGLYDQSVYFDNALSRYYKAKGWNIFQYSLLRSLSELLILKILVKRYPDLQTQQVSCHAAHEVDGKMKPCGKCEKCRRIIGMLVALSEDPKRCGYTDEQIEKGLKALSQKSVKQIGSDAAHLYHILLSKNAIEKTAHSEKLAKEHKEIMQLRFDQERTNLQDLPSHIRADMIEIFEQYADGAVQLESKKWIHTNLKDRLQVPYFLKSESIESA